MKRIFSYIIVATVAAVAFVSCSSDDNPFPKMSDDLSVIYASTSSATRASINTTPDDDGNYDVVWEEDDHILIVDNVGNQKEFQLIEGAGTTYGKFKECDASQTLSDGTFTAYYPVSSYDPTNGTFKWTVGSQKFSEGIGFSGVPMKATPSEPIADKRVPNFTFSNEAGIFKVNIKANEDVAAAEVRIGKITVKVKGADDASITYDNPGFLTTDGNTYYIMMPYQTIQAGECQFQIEDHKSRPFCMATNKGAITIEQSKINSTYITVAEDNPGYLCFHEYSNLAPCTVQLVPLDEGEDDGWKTASGKVRKASQPKTADPNPNPRELEYSYNLIKWYKYTGSPVEYDKLEHVFFRRKPSEGVATKFNSQNDIMRFKVEASKNAEGFYGRTRVLGNVMSIIDWTCTSVTIPNDYCFASLFRDNEYIHEVANLYLPATTLAESCYEGMFQNCSELVNLPDMTAATQLAETCCKAMFFYCNKLENIPSTFTLSAATLSDHCYNQMFAYCSKLKSVDTDLLQNATTLGSYSCFRMFDKCTSLTTAPAISATTLDYCSCYYMFDGCTSLTTVPAISATTLGSYSCSYMFNGCTSLITAPAISATTLGSCSCYYMFNGCTSLTTAPTLNNVTLLEGTHNCAYMFNGCSALTAAPPVLKAMVLQPCCYYHMFQGCTSLVTGPELKATDIDVEYCYREMFSGCTSLKSVTVHFPKWIIGEPNYPTYHWLENVAGEGTIIGPSTLPTPSLPSSSSCPTGWNVQPIPNN